MRRKKLEPGLTSYRVDLQVLRGIAVLGVLLFHAKQSIFPLGYLGVDIFFVISGFVVTPLILRIFPQSEIFDSGETLNRLRAFFIRRLFRLAPALGASLILAVLLVVILSPSWNDRNFPHQAIATLLLVGNWGAQTFVGDYFHGSSSPIIHTWSLSAEEQIYILIPLLFFFLSIFFRRFRKSSILKTLLLIGIFCFIAQFLIQFISNKFLGFDAGVIKNVLFYSPVSRLWEFSLGTFVYTLSANKMNEVRFTKNLGSFILLVASLIGTVYFLFFDPWPLISTIAAIGTIYFQVLLRLPRIAQSLLAWVGDRSYSIYLVHLPLMYVAKNSPIFGDARRQIVTGLAFVISILIGSVMFSQIENRFRISDRSTSSVKKIVGIYVLIPLICFSSLDLAITRNYWGALNIQLPSSGSLVQDKFCQNFDSLAPCVYEKGAAPGGIDNILIGDSHADSISTVIGSVVSARSESYTVWTKGNCPFILRESIKEDKYKEVLASLSTVSSKVSCLEHNQQILDYEPSGVPIRVWVTNRNTQGYRTTFSWNISNDDIRKLIEVNLRILANNSLKVIYIGPVPEKVFGDVPNHRLIWQLERGETTNFRILDLPTGPFDDNRFFSKSILPDNLSYINPIDVFCGLSSCILGRDYQFYSDSHHLNVTGSEKLKAFFEAAFN